MIPNQQKYNTTDLCVRTSPTSQELSKAMRLPLSSLTYFERRKGKSKNKSQQEQSKQIVSQVLPLKDLDKTEPSF